MTTAVEDLLTPALQNPLLHSLHPEEHVLALAQRQALRELAAGEPGAAVRFLEGIDAEHSRESHYLAEHARVAKHNSKWLLSIGLEPAAGGRNREPADDETACRWWARTVEIARHWQTDTTRLDGRRAALAADPSMKRIAGPKCPHPDCPLCAAQPDAVLLNLEAALQYAVNEMADRGYKEAT